MFEKNTYADLICQDIQNEYHSLPEHLWARFPNYTVFRHQDNQKWFALIMDIPKEKLGMPGTDIVHILILSTCINCINNIKVIKSIQILCKKQVL